ncbi:hypothetical protein AAIB98_003497 [Providencia rettgeri]|nr:hypothetical protein [Providencia rettgeri]
MKNEIVSFAPFVFGSTQIRTINYDGDPWFVAVDVCKALNISNVTDALYKLDEDEKETIGLTESQAGHGAQSLNIISESGMYTLVLRCRDAIKKGSVPHKFRKWVTNEVLPSVRKSGSYSAKDSTTLSDDDLQFLCWMWKFNHSMANAMTAIHPLLRVAEHRLEGKFYETPKEAKRNAEICRAILDKATAHINIKRNQLDNWRILHGIREPEMVIYQ